MCNVKKKGRVSILEIRTILPSILWEIMRFKVNSGKTNSLVKISVTFCFQ